MLKAITYPFSLLKVMKLEENGEYKKAIDILLDYRSFIEDKKNKFPDYYIILAELHARLGKYGDSEKLFINAINILNDTNYFNKDEKNYLKKYSYLWLKYIAEVYKNTLAANKYEALINGLFYSEEKIRKSLKVDFSMSTFS